MPQFLKWEVIEAIERGAYRTLLYGPPGTGKTRSAYNAAQALKKPFYNVTLSDETSAAEIRGHWIPQSAGKWKWMHGPAMLAAIEGGLLLLDEIDKASQDCLDFLHGLLNDPEVAQIVLPSGEKIQPSPEFQVIATMNGDIGDLLPSLQDRFSIAIEVTTPHPDAVAALPEDLRGAASNVESYDAIQRPATLRRWAAFATLRELEGVGVDNAAKAVFAHRAKELMDSIGFTATITVADEVLEAEVEEEELEAPCTCSDCMELRARAWFLCEFEEDPEFDESDDTYKCFACGDWHSSETQALMCCYDEAHWISYCRSEGRPWS